LIILINFSLKPTGSTKKADDKADLDVKLQEDDLLDKVRQILQKPVEIRIKSDLKILSSFFKSTQIFQKLQIPEDDEQEKMMLLSALTYQKAKKKDYIWHFGDSGDTFYIVLSGKVQVSVPVTETTHIGTESEICKPKVKFIEIYTNGD